MTQTVSKGLLAGVVIAFLLAAPFFLYPFFLMKLMCFALFAAAFNLLVGYVGLLSFGHAAFFGSAAYLAGHIVKEWGWPAESAILISVAAASLLGLAVGWISIRRQGIYFAMITLALAQVVYFVALQAPFTGGEDGIQSIPRPVLLGFWDTSDDRSLYYFVLAACLFGILAIYRIINSPFGEVLRGIRENETRTQSLGFETSRYKLTVFVLSAALAGLAGGVKVFVFQIATLTDVHWQTSGEVVLMTLIGGLGTFLGPIVGAVILISMQNFLAFLGEWVLVIQGVIFMVVVLLFRRGVVGEVNEFIRRRAARISEAKGSEGSSSENERS